jgi:hypothetical protein
MPSKQITDREKSARAVTAAAVQHASAIHEGLKGELATHLRQGETMPDVDLLIRLLGRKIEADMSTAVQADKAHDAELADDAAPREARDTAYEKVREVLVDLRASVDAAYGPAGLNALGLTGAVPVDPSVVATFAGSVLEALEDGARKLPKPRRAGIQVDRAAFAKDLAAELPALKKALKDVAREEREKETTKLTRDEAMATSDRTFSRAASLIEALAEGAGLEEVAARVKPSGRSPGRTAAEDPPVEGGGNATPPPDGNLPAGS